MWGDNWGEMIWGGSGVSVPSLDPVAIVVLVVVLLIGAIVTARRASAPR